MEHVITFPIPLSIIYGNTHAVCVCKIHQNIKLMMICGKIVEQCAEDEIPLKEYGPCIARRLYHHFGRTAQNMVTVFS